MKTKRSLGHRRLLQANPADHLLQHVVKMQQSHWLLGNPRDKQGKCDWLWGHARECKFLHFVVYVGHALQEHDGKM